MSMNRFAVGALAVGMALGMIAADEGTVKPESLAQSEQDSLSRVALKISNIQNQSANLKLQAEDLSRQLEAAQRDAQALVKTLQEKYKMEKCNPVLTEDGKGAPSLWTWSCPAPAKLN